MDDLHIAKIISQVINLSILFFLFKHFLGDMIIDTITKRREMLAKIAWWNAEYEKRIAAAEEEKKRLIHEWVTHKNEIIEESKNLAWQQRDTIIERANAQAEEITTQATIKTQSLQKELENSWEDSVKTATNSVVKKLLNVDPASKKQYIDQIVSDFTRSS